MARELVDDELWEIVRPLLPPHQSLAGCKRLDERRVFTGILFILQSELPYGGRVAISVADDHRKGKQGQHVRPVLLVLPQAAARRWRRRAPTGKAKQNI